MQAVRKPINYFNKKCQPFNFLHACKNLHKSSQCLETVTLKHQNLSNKYFRYHGIIFFMRTTPEAHHKTILLQATKICLHDYVRGHAAKISVSRDIC